MWQEAALNPLRMTSHNLAAEGRATGLHPSTVGRADIWRGTRSTILVEAVDIRIAPFGL